MEIKVTKGDVLSGYIAQIFQYGSGIIVLPVILNRLSPEEIGMNYVILSVGAMVNMADFGFSGLIGRNITYVLSGAQQIYRGQIEHAEESKQINYHLLKVIIDASRYLFNRLSIACFFLMLTLGTLYMHYVTEGFTNVNNSFSIWLLFSLSVYFNLFFMYYDSLLRGAALMKEQRLAVIFSRSVYIIICFVMIYLGYGLISVVIANLVAPFISRYYSYKKFFSSEMKYNLPKEKSGKAEIHQAISDIWFTAKKSGTNTIGHYVATNGGVFIAGLYLPLAITAQWGLMTQLFNVVRAVAMNLTMTYYPEYCKLRLQNDRDSLIGRSSFATMSMVMILLVGGLIIIMAGGWLLQMIQSRTYLPSVSLILVYLLFVIIQSNAQSFAMLMTTRNVVPSPKAVLTTSVLQIVLTVLFLVFSDIGMWALLIGPFTCGMAYTLWAWMKIELDNLEISAINFYARGCVEIFNMTRRVLIGCK